MSVEHCYVLAGGRQKQLAEIALEEPLGVLLA